jgi:general secretion pathway protein G
MPMRNHVVASILSLFAVLALAHQRFGGYDDCYSRPVRLRLQLDNLAADIAQFEFDTGALPHSLQALVDEPESGPGPYARARDLLDPWGFPVQYQRLSTPEQFVVYSLGSDGMLGGSGDSRDQQATRLDIEPAVDSKVWTHEPHDAEAFDDAATDRPSR